MKFIIIPKSLKDLDLYKNKGADTFIFGLRNYAVNYPNLTLEKIKEISPHTNLFIAVNKNIFNQDLADLRKVLKELAKLPILGVLFYDLGVINIVLEEKIDLNLVWHNTHQVTNYKTINYLKEKGIKGAYLTNEITLEDRLKIANETDLELMTLVLGHPVISHSKRSLLTNYFNALGKKKSKDTYLIKERTGDYIVTEKDNETSIYDKRIINGVGALFSLKEKIAYGVIDTTFISNDICLEVLDIFNLINKGEIKEIEAINKVNNLVGDYSGFFYQKTIYKVKKDE